MKLRLFNRMKRFYLFLFALLIISPKIHGERVITSFDIARWYLDADLVVVSNLIESETTHVRSIDTASTGGYSIKCDFLRDLYLVVIDSVLKGCPYQDTILIMTPEYSINCEKYRITDSTEIIVSTPGDTTFLISVEVVPYNYDSGNYYRMGTETRSIFFLRETPDRYVTIYVMHDINDANLQFLNEVEKKGETYFDLLKTK